MDKIIPEKYMSLIKIINKEVNDDCERIISIMQTIDVSKRKKEYLLFDTALTYLTYQSLVSSHDEVAIAPIHNCVKRISKNIQELNNLQ